MSQTIRRFGQVIGLRPEQVEEYKRLHAGPGVRDLLRQANFRNFSIFLLPLPGGQLLEFAYYEYHGDNFEQDSAWLAAQPDNQAWQVVCSAMQIPLEGETGWTRLESVFYND